MKIQTAKGKKKISHRAAIRWRLVVYDLLIFFAVSFAFLVIYPSSLDLLNAYSIGQIMFWLVLFVFGARFILNIYRQIWRYPSMQAYLRLLIADAVGGACVVLLRVFPFMPNITLPRLCALEAVNLLGTLSVRILYQYLYQVSYASPFIRLVRSLFNLITGTNMQDIPEGSSVNRIKIAIVGAGQVGVTLAEELIHNKRSAYQVVCFVDRSRHKVGRAIYTLPVLQEDDGELKHLFMQMGVQEVIIALPSIDSERKRKLYELYNGMGLRVKNYDYPIMQETGAKRRVRDFEPDELLFRTPRSLITEDVAAYYRGKTIMITGGGGSIGSEMCRQIAKMQPKQLIIMDVYENSAYDIQQELLLKYKGKFDMRVEIATMCNSVEMDQIMGCFKPDVLIHCAAHKHVPLMERNPLEAVLNNVFGTLNVLEACEKHGVARFMMVSTDKAVNPTNVMGATKRMNEMMVLNWPGKMKVSATRFGNVLGSAGSVVPLFKRQIKNGGPITLTDKRIIRYFMTIPEASQLVLTSGVMAQDRDLFVLDMGKPVRILDMAENMVRLCGLEPYKDIDIIETGLRPGEKLYEELLIDSDNLIKTDNELIFIEREECIPWPEVEEKLSKLRAAVLTQSLRNVRDTLKEVVPTFRSPEEVNAEALKAREMQSVATE